MSVSTYPTSLLISQLATALHAVMKYSAVISVCAWPARINDDGKAVCGSQLFTEVFVKGFEDIGVYSAELIYDAELIGGHYDEEGIAFTWSGDDYCFFNSNSVHGIILYDEKGVQIDRQGEDDFVNKHFGLVCHETAGKEILEQALSQLSEVEKRQFLRIVLKSYNRIQRTHNIRDQMDSAIKFLDNKMETSEFLYI